MYAAKDKKEKALAGMVKLIAGLDDEYGGDYKTFVFDLDTFQFFFFIKCGKNSLEPDIKPTN